MTISEINIYPIKSLGGIRLESANVYERGLEHDRRMMLVDVSGKFMTKREFHSLEFLCCKFENNNLVVYDSRAPGNYLEVPFSLDGDVELPVTVWNDAMPASRFGKRYDEFFSDFLQHKCILVKMSEDTKRPVETSAGISNGMVSFADAFPYLIVSQASLDNLNSKLLHPVGMDRFRPNIVVDGPVAFAEDSWSEFHAGTAGFKVIRPSSRCIMTTIDPVSGYPGKEPLQTLASYRKQGNEVFFGANAIAIKTGEIHFGDTLHFF